MITKIKKIQKSILNITNEQELKTHNLIFGYNGTGKTTLSKIFHQIEQDNNFDTSEYKFELEASYTPYVRVFYGEEYIKRNIVGDNRNPIVFAIDDEQNDLKTEKTTLIDRKTRVETKINELDSKINNLNGEVSNLKTNLGRNIGNTLGLRSYNATNVQTDFNSMQAKILELTQLPEDERTNQFEQNTSIRSNASNKAEIQLRINNANNSLQSNSHTINSLLAEQLQAPQQAEELFNKIRMEYEKPSNQRFQQFIQIGFISSIFQEHKTCPFCFRALDNLFQNFVDYFNKQVEDHKTELERVKTSILQEQQARETLIYSIPSEGQFFDDKIESIRSYTNEIKDLHDLIKQQEQIVVAELDKKINNPYVPIVDYSVPDISDMVEEINSKFSEINAIITAHDERVREFEQNRTNAGNWIKAYYLIELKNKINENKPKIQRLTKWKEKYEQIKRDFTNRIDEIDTELLNFEPFVDEYNMYLQQILGRTDISLTYDTTSSGYKLQRNGNNAEFTSFSEGEKTAIAVIHFILSLKDSRKGDISNCIVIIDDPICSLDTNNLYGIYAFLKPQLKTVKQLVILTHHFYFFKRVQQWFQHIKKIGSTYTHQSLFLDKRYTTQYKSTLEPVPNDLDKYDSEYQYLFDKLQQLKLKNNDPQQTLTFEECVSLPNECRRVLESIASFIEPFGNLHNNRIIIIREEIVSSFPDGEKDKIEQALDYVYRYTNTESHLQLFDDSLYFQNNSDEAKKLINAIIELIEKLVPHHLNKYQQINQTS